MEDQVFGVGHGAGENEATTLCQRTRKRAVEEVKSQDHGRESKSSC